ncbi:DUF6529 family protein [Streptomyces sp. H10-C2]|uniref:DUF6529 family protein n=1 Tax=unclassified Streptomyces TaxID=2593676 RepID=UPI0024B885EA|nr:MULTISPECIES: DUF6529 family protein [unclassified Streptomyces]MDJ0341049.1 DUF6529 family protein [Streptomyces sp. PH10-H1]MDJ0369719.1 DUF6529 family protein [Streptomyces sp. H10-C2]
MLLPVAVAVALYALGRTLTPDYTSSLFGRRGNDANELKARLGSALLALALAGRVRHVLDLRAVHPLRRRSRR